MLKTSDYRKRLGPRWKIPVRSIAVVTALFAMTHFTSMLRGDNITNPGCSAAANTVTGTIVDNTGAPVPAGTTVTVTFNHKTLGTTTVSVTAGTGGSVTVSVPAGYKPSTFTVQDGGTVSPSHKLGHHWWHGWNVDDDPIVSGSTDYWSLTEDSGTTYAAEWFDGQDTTIDEYTVLDMGMQVTYGDDVNGVFEVTLDSGFIELSDDIDITLDAGSIGYIDTNQLTFAFELNGVYNDACSWSMYWTGSLEETGDSECPYALHGDSSGLSVPEPATSLLLFILAGLVMLHHWKKHC